MSLNDQFTPGQDPKPIRVPVTHGPHLPESATEGAMHIMDVAPENVQPVQPEVLPHQPPTNGGGGGLKLGSNLPPALPPYDYNPEEAFQLLGMEYAHRMALSRLVLQRAQETNEIHDGLLAVIQRAQRLEQELQDAREERTKLEQATMEFQKMATEVNERLATELRVVMDERDQLRDEVAILKLEKPKTKKEKPTT